jgi:hypothetical protein
VELAIASWKCIINVEMTKAKEICEELEEEKKRVSCKLEHISLRHQVQNDMDFYMSKINYYEPKVSFFKCTTITKQTRFITNDKNLPWNSVPTPCFMMLDALALL